MEFEGYRLKTDWNGHNHEEFLGSILRSAVQAIPFEGYGETQFDYPLYWAGPRLTSECTFIDPRSGKSFLLTIEKEFLARTPESLSHMQEMANFFKKFLEHPDCYRSCACEFCKTMKIVPKLPTPKTTFLHDAVEAENVGEMKKILMNCSHDKETWNKDGLTPLQFAVKNRIYSCIRTLVEYRCSVEKYKSRDGKTALDIAMDTNAPEEVIKLLCEYAHWQRVL